MNNGGHLAIRTAKRVAVMALLVPVGGGCGGRGDPVGAASLQAHLQATDERLAATEKRLESLATAVEECNRHFHAAAAGRHGHKMAPAGWISLPPGPPTRVADYFFTTIAERATSMF